MGISSISCGFHRTVFCSDVLAVESPVRRIGLVSFLTSLFAALCRVECPPLWHLFCFPLFPQKRTRVCIELFGRLLPSAILGVAGVDCTAPGAGWSVARLPAHRASASGACVWSRWPGERAVCSRTARGPAVHGLTRQHAFLAQKQEKRAGGSWEPRPAACTAAWPSPGTGRPRPSRLPP